jgi:molecular chaperone DnaJ
MANNYYITLGISRGANLNQIKKAYRQIAKKVHPDTTQSMDSRRFTEVREAYETLADENARRQYDAKLQRQPTPVRISSLVDEIKQRSSSFNELKRFESFVDEFFEGFVPGFFHKERNRPPQKDLYYEVVLSPSEAMHGGLFPIRVPVIEKCSQCHQNEFWDSFYCSECDGCGYRHAEKEFSLSIPPRTDHNTEATVSLEDIGLPDVNLFVRIQIDSFLE